MHQSALSQKEKQEVLNAHNKFRKFVASGQELRGVGGRQPAGIIPPLVSQILSFKYLNYYEQKMWLFDIQLNR